MAGASGAQAVAAAPAPVAPVDPVAPAAPAAPAGPDFRITRSLSAFDDNSAVSPPPLGRGGDYLEFDREAHCGFYSWESSAGADDGQLWIICKGEAVAGPFTTAAQIKQVTAVLTAQRAQRHEMMMGIINSYPSAQRYRVYDTNGTYLGDQYR